MKMKEINDEFVEIIKKDFEGNMKSGREVVEYIAESTAMYRGDPIYSLYMPRLFPENVVAYLKNAAETMHGILSKVIRNYMDDPEYRKLFGFPQDTGELILTPALYDSLLPMARIDIFFNEDDMSFKFCEFNTDGSSGMNEDRELCNGFRGTAAYRELSRKYRLESFELFSSWCAAVEKIYEGFENKTEDPRVGIVDFTEKGCSPEEFGVFRDTFVKRGMDAEICEIRDMKYRNGILYSGSGKRIDIIYRRAVTCDILNAKDEVKDFLRAVKDGSVCLVGNFRSHVVHDKIAFEVLRLPETSRFLTSREIDFIKEHVPYTAELRSGTADADEIINSREKWIIKPRDSYGARNVFAGIKFSRDQWQDLIYKHMDSDYLIQEFCMPYESENIDFRLKEPGFKKYSNLTGMYVYDGVFAGFYSRTSDETIIAEQYDENDVASFMIKER